MEPTGNQEWADRQLRELAVEGAPPDAARAWSRLVERRRVRRRRTHAAAVGLAMAVVLVALPAPRAVARQCVEMCLAGPVARWGEYVLSRLKPGQSRHSASYAPRPLAPDFSLPDSSGRALQLSALRGRVVLLNFWATWCPPCREETPWLVQWQNELAGKGFAVVGVSADEGGWDAVRPFLALHRVNYPVVLGNDALYRLFGGLESVPTTLLIDRQGRVAATHLGAVPAATLRREIGALL
ncbi:MAG: TlpA family protein disulfide reductase, partial [Bryobacterales bacterium]|nr:TlpA family protein disulfide reductase [Bryobacterales bacterium]